MLNFQFMGENHILYSITKVSEGVVQFGNLSFYLGLILKKHKYLVQELVKFHDLQLTNGFEMIRQIIFTFLNYFIKFNVIKRNLKRHGRKFKQFLNVAKERNINLLFLYKRQDNYVQETVIITFQLFFVKLFKEGRVQN